MNQRLSIDALRALLCVIDTGSMTRAAQQLNLSQSAVSWKIKRLEEQLGRTLLDRQGRHWPSPQTVRCWPNTGGAF